jgi:hypothetical protein
MSKGKGSQNVYHGPGTVMVRQTVQMAMMNISAVSTEFPGKPVFLGLPRQLSLSFSPPFSCSIPSRVMHSEDSIQEIWGEKVNYSLRICPVHLAMMDNLTSSAALLS